MAKGKSNKGFLYGLLAGGLVGSISALLFAPKSGRELRQDIASGAQQVGDQTVKLAGQVSDTTVKIAGQVGQTSTTFVKQVGSGAANIAGKVKQSTGDVIESVKNWKNGSSDEEKAAQEEELVSDTAASQAKEKELTTVG